MQIIPYEPLQAQIDNGTAVELGRGGFAWVYHVTRGQEPHLEHMAMKKLVERDGTPSKRDGVDFIREVSSQLF